MVGNDFEEVFIVLMFRKIVILLFEGKVLGLDKVIFYSIDCCLFDDIKKKMYSFILVVGGGLMFYKV